MITKPLTVRELIAKLSALDPDVRVVFYTEDEEFHTPGHGHRLLDVIEISETDVETYCGDDGIPGMRVGKLPQSVPTAIIELTADI